MFYKDPIQILIKKGLVVGENFHMQKYAIIDYSHCWHIKIGNDVTLAPRVHILAHDASTKIHLNHAKIGKVKIGDRVFIGAGSIILPGVTIGDDVIIGAGSIVSRDIPDGQVAVGNPAKIICSLEEFLDKRKKEMDIYPCFGKEYTEKWNVTKGMKEEMNKKIKDKIGFIV
ncbi:MAG: acyltransferase [Candidatus Delongbacteria bacterium]|nr:acyltransferase [Candidatus Delongbacteria bacterium]